MLDSVPSLSVAYQRRLDELDQLRQNFVDRRLALHDECATEAARLKLIEPPELLPCRLNSLDSLMPDGWDSAGMHSTLYHQCAQRVALAEEELNEMVIRLQRADDEELRAEMYESKIGCRRSEVQLWERGVKIISPKEATRYQAALSADPQFTALCSAYTRLATLYKRKRRVELQVADLNKQIHAIGGQLRKVKREYAAIKAEQARGGLTL